MLWEFPKGALPRDWGCLFIHSLNVFVCFLNVSETQWTKSGINTCSRGTKRKMVAQPTVRVGPTITDLYNEFVYYFLSPIRFLIDAVVMVVKCVNIASRSDEKQSRMRIYSLCSPCWSGSSHLCCCAGLLMYKPLQRVLEEVGQGLSYLYPRNRFVPLTGSSPSSPEEQAASHRRKRKQMKRKWRREQ